MMNLNLEIAYDLVGAALVGALLSAFYFGGLWMTVRAIPKSRTPALLLITSFAVRTVIVLAGFWLVMHRSLSALAAALVMFTIVRAVIVCWIGNAPMRVGNGRPHE